MIIGNLKKPGGRIFVCAAEWGYNNTARPACDAGEAVI